MGANFLMEVFCIKTNEDPIPPMMLSSLFNAAALPDPRLSSRKNMTTMEFGVEEEDVLEKVKEDTWVLAIILGCFCVLCLIAGAVTAVYQMKKTKRKEKIVKNVQESWDAGNK